MLNGYSCDSACMCANLCKNATERPFDEMSFGKAFWYGELCKLQIQLVYLCIRIISFYCLLGYFVMHVLLHHAGSSIFHSLMVNVSMRHIRRIAQLMHCSQRSRPQRERNKRFRPCKTFGAADVALVAPASQALLEALTNDIVFILRFCKVFCIFYLNSNL